MVYYDNDCGDDITTQVIAGNGSTEELRWINRLSILKIIADLGSL
jgi:hypothetical protein